MPAEEPKPSLPSKHKQARRCPEGQEAGRRQERLAVTPCLPAGEAGQGGPAGGGAAPAAGQPEAAGGVADGGRPAAHLHRVVLQHRGQEVLAGRPPGPPRRLQPGGEVVAVPPPGVKSLLSAVSGTVPPQEGAAVSAGTPA